MTLQHRRRNAILLSDSRASTTSLEKMIKTKLQKGVNPFNPHVIWFLFLSLFIYLSFNSHVIWFLFLYLFIPFFSLTWLNQNVKKKEKESLINSLHSNLISFLFFPLTCRPGVWGQANSRTRWVMGEEAAKVREREVRSTDRMGN